MEEDHIQYPTIETPLGPLQLRVRFAENNPTNTVLVYSHGIGAHKENDFVKILSEEMAKRGITTVSYDANFAAPKMNGSYKVAVKDQTMTLAAQEANIAVGYARDVLKSDNIIAGASSLGAYPAINAARNNPKEVKKAFLYAPALNTEMFTDNKWLMRVWRVIKYLPINPFKGLYSHINFLRDAQRHNSAKMAGEASAQFFVYAGTSDGMNPFKFSQQFADVLPEKVTLQPVDANLHPMRLSGDANKKLISDGVAAFTDWLDKDEGVKKPEEVVVPATEKSVEETPAKTADTPADQPSLRTADRLKDMLAQNRGGGGSGVEKPANEAKTDVSAKARRLVVR